MNRTYRSVWNQALGAWVATSELGGRLCKGGRHGAIGAAALLAIMANVGEGVAGTDAVNVNQLNAGLEGNRQYTDQRFNQLNSDLRKTAKQANAGTASAIAMANLPQAYIPGKSMVSLGVGGYDGEAGIALGVSKLSDNGRWVVKFSATGNSRSKFGVGAGAGFHW